MQIYIYYLLFTNRLNFGESMWICVILFISQKKIFSLYRRKSTKATIPNHGISKKYSISMHVCPTLTLQFNWLLLEFEWEWVIWLSRTIRKKTKVSSTPSKCSMHFSGCRRHTECDMDGLWARKLTKALFILPSHFSHSGKLTDMKVAK